MNPSTGRFTSVDPAEGNSLEPNTFHVYLYSKDSPVSFTDHSGKNYTLAGQMMAISVNSILTSLVKATLVGFLINELRDLPVRMNHYTEWKWIPKIMGGGVDCPSGINYFTPDWYFSGEDAQAHLSLKNKPEVMINLTLYPKRDRLTPPYPSAHTVDSKYGQNGGGREYWTEKLIPYWTRFAVLMPLF